MSKVEKRKELNTASLNSDEMIKSYPVMRLVVMSIILIALTVIAVLSFMYKEYVCAIGIILFVIYVCVLTFGQKSTDYSFEFREGTGLAGFKISTSGSTPSNQLLKSGVTRSFKSTTKRFLLSRMTAAGTKFDFLNWLCNHFSFINNDTSVGWRVASVHFPNVHL